MAIIVSDEVLEAYYAAREKREDVEKRLVALRIELRAAEMVEEEAAHKIREAVKKAYDGEFPES